MTTHLHVLCCHYTTPGQARRRDSNPHRFSIDVAHMLYTSSTLLTSSTTLSDTGENTIYFLPHVYSGPMRPGSFGQPTLDNLRLSKPSPVFSACASIPKHAHFLFYSGGAVAFRIPLFVFRSGSIYSLGPLNRVLVNKNSSCTTISCLK